MFKINSKGKTYRKLQILKKCNFNRRFSLDDARTVYIELYHVSLSENLRYYKKNFSSNKLGLNIPFSGFRWYK